MSVRAPWNLIEAERAELERAARRSSKPQTPVQWCRVILLDDGKRLTQAETGERRSRCARRPCSVAESVPVAYASGHA